MIKIQLYKIILNVKKYSLKAGIVGLPNVGKSTLFNAFGSGKALAANYPFATIEPNVGIVTVPDDRLIKLSEIVKPEKITNLTMKMVDIAGLVKGASKGDGLGNKFLSHIREVDTIAQVVRCFENDVIANVNNTVDPCRDVDIIETELILKDIETLEKILKKAEKLSKKDTKLLEKYNFYISLFQHLSLGKVAKIIKITNPEHKLFLDEIQLLTTKPIIYVANISENHQDNKDHVEKLEKLVSSKNSVLIKVCAELEAQMIELEKNDRIEFMNNLGIKESSLEKLIKAAYQSLDIVTFYTQGPTEVRAWNVKKGSTAPQAGREIHSDFESHFIKAEIIKYDDFIKFNGHESSLKQNKKITSEGKEYIVKDGDIILFKKKN